MTTGNKTGAAAFRRRKPGLISELSWREYGVLVPWVNTKDGPMLLFEVRAQNLRHQPGEISFPGGAVEEGESAEAAARRETTEELLVSDRDIEIFGPNDIFIAPGGRRLDSFIGRVNEYEGTFSTDEVDHVFLAPMAELQTLEPEVYTNRMHMEPDPAFPLEEIGKNGSYQWLSGSYKILIYRWRDYRIWGMTARLLQSALELIAQYDLERVLADPDVKPVSPEPTGE
ncbi:MAG: NUDIX domain-containing protein [Peptoniphilaceae bacterium]|nr:NUDIX domain-containing protein [Peptoniphilaceae bacterium]MDY6086264.1 NUDIX domain-containing protein [Peptoniphilaceae bacterium]